MALAVGAIAVHFADPRALATSLAASVKAASGRELAFSAVSVRLLPRPALLVSQLRLGNAAWATQPWLASVEQLSVEADLLALLAGRLRARRIALSGVHAWLETDDDGVGNWVIGSAKDGAPDWLKAVEIDAIDLATVALDYRQGRSGKTSSLLIDAARIDEPLAPKPTRLSARASIDGRRVEIAATLGNLATLLGDAPDYPVDVALRSGATYIAAQGSIDRPLGAATLNLALHAEAPEFAEFAEFTQLAALFGAKLPQLGALRGTARLSGTASAPALTQIDVTLGEQTTHLLALSGAVADLRAATGVDLRLRAQTTGAVLPRLPPLRINARLRDDAVGYRLDELALDVADSKVSAALQLARVGQRLRVSGELSSPLVDLARWAPPAADKAQATEQKPLAEQTLDLDLNLKIARLVLPDGRPLQAVSGRLTLERGKLGAKALQASVGGAQVAIDGSIADPRQLAGIDLDVSLKGGELGELCKFFGHEVAPLGAYHGRAHLSDSRAALRASAIKLSVGRAGQQLQASGEIGDILARRGIALAVAATISDSEAAGRLFGATLPRLPLINAAARLSDVAGGYAVDDLAVALGRSTLRGRAVFTDGGARRRITATLSSPLIEFAELHAELRAVPKRPPAAKPQAADEAIDLDATLQIDRLQLPNRRSLGPLNGTARLTAGALELKQFNVAVDGAQATLDGRIGDPLALRAIDLLIDAKLTHSAGLAALTGTDLGALPACTASGRLSDIADGYRLAELKLKLPATTIAGEVAVTRGKARPKVSIKASSPLLDLNELHFAATGAKQAARRTRLIPDMALPVQSLKRVDGDVELRFDAVKFGAASPLGPLLVRALLTDGRLDAGPLQLAAADQMLSGSATIDAGSAAWTARLAATQIDLDKTLARAGYPGLISGGRSDLALQLRAHGQSLAALVASLDGELRLKVGALRAHNVAVNLGEGLLTRTLSLINPFLKSDPDTDIKCIAAKLPIKQGVLTSERRFAIETAKYNAVLGGTLDLRSERFDLAVQPVIKGGRGIGASELASIVRLRGTLAEPEVGIDAGGLAKSAVSIGAAVATFGGWWLADAVRKQIKADTSPCATALAR